MPADSPVLVLTDPAACDPWRTGGKMAVLARLRQLGCAVPDGFTLTVAGHRDPCWREAVMRAYADLGGPPVAVRSSATDEDLAGHTAAGLYETVLDVVGADALLAAVGICLVAADSAHRRAYTGTGPAGMAVGVQRMVRPVLAGVAFSRDPLGTGRLVVEAVPGPLAPLVSGQVVPHHVALDPSGRVEVDEPGEHGPVLDLDSLLVVRELTLALEVELAHPVDVEWALDTERLWVLQCRDAAAPRT